MERGYKFRLVYPVKNPPAVWGTWVQSLGQEDTLEKAWQPTPIFLPGESPWTEEPGRLQSMGSQRVDSTERLSTPHPLVSSHPPKIWSKTSQQWESPSVKFEVPVRPLKRYVAAILILQFIYTRAAIDYIIVC